MRNVLLAPAVAMGTRAGVNIKEDVPPASLLLSETSNGIKILHSQGHLKLKDFEKSELICEKPNILAITTQFIALFLCIPSPEQVLSFPAIIVNMHEYNTKELVS